MARPLRLQFPGALYHVTSRDDGQEGIYLSDEDRLMFLTVLSQAKERLNGVIHTNYHMLVEAASGGYTQKQVGDFFGIHYSRVSKIIKRAESNAERAKRKT